MSRSVWTDKDLLDSIAEIQLSEEDKYDEIPKWKNEYLSKSQRALLLSFPDSKGDKREIWFPLTQLRIAEDRQSIYCSIWFLHKIGLA